MELAGEDRLSAHGLSDVALVTGASSGIGQATSIELARRHRVACLDQRDPSETVAAILDGGGTAMALQADVTDASQVHAAIDEVAKKWDRVSVGIHCAAIVDWGGLSELTLEAWDRVITVNLTGTFIVAQGLLEQMPRGGRLVLLSSVAGHMGGVRSGPAYAATKGGILAFMKWGARFYAPRGITINAVAPGPIATPMTADQGYSAEGIPVGRLGTVGDVVAAIAYLSSPEAAFVTGATLDVNGGIFMK